jgi:glycogen debranching enzyme GlgX
VPTPELGAVTDATGTTFTVFSSSATAVEVCFLENGQERRIGLEPIGGHLWSGRVAGVQAGTEYGLRVDGAFDPKHGQRHDPAKLLADPYTRELRGSLQLHEDLLLRGQDSAAYVPRSVVRDALPPLPRLTPVPWRDTVVYELHVRGFTRRHPGVPEQLRGTYAGLASPAALEHLTSLGITTVELLPAQAYASEIPLLRRGLTNYWGYSTLAFFAPHPAYAATDDPVTEFRAMVTGLHEAGLEVVMDVVYNHTAEGDENGPTLAYRGLDNAAYYRLRPGSLRRYQDTTGCGNMLDLRHPAALQLVMDSLRYWAGEMGVDGFRFDLAPALTRDTAFLAAVAQDPLLRKVKLIAEPWDLGPDGYQVGRFPAPWAEWNGKYRDSVRDVWREAGTGVADLGYRLTGSSDLYDHDGRAPVASVNFVTSHDGFPLADLVSYEQKHNEANGEGNRDGEAHNRSTNSGVEGPTDDPEVLARRRRLRRAHLATLLLSAGVPMLLAGDELGRTQGGNNNAYCQDNDISWLEWPPAPGGAAPHDPAGGDPQLLPLVRGLLALRRSSPLLRRTRFFAGGPSSAEALADITWLRADGEQMTDSDWSGAQVLTLLALLADPAQRPGSPAEPGSEPLLLVLHPQSADTTVTLPRAPWAPQGTAFHLVLDTAANDLAGFPDRVGAGILPGQQVPLLGGSVQVYRLEHRRD